MICESYYLPHCQYQIDISTTKKPVQRIFYTFKIRRNHIIVTDYPNGALLVLDDMNGRTGELSEIIETEHNIPMLAVYNDICTTSIDEK